MKCLDDKQLINPAAGKIILTTWPHMLQMDKNIHTFLSGNSQYHLGA